jgi:hypothetical protein
MHTTLIQNLQCEKLRPASNYIHLRDMGLALTNANSAAAPLIQIMHQRLRSNDMKTKTARNQYRK